MAHAGSTSQVGLSSSRFHASSKVVVGMIFSSSIVALPQITSIMKP